MNSKIFSAIAVVLLGLSSAAAAQNKVRLENGVIVSNPDIKVAGGA